MNRKPPTALERAGSIAASARAFGFKDWPQLWDAIRFEIEAAEREEREACALICEERGMDATKATHSIRARGDK